MKTSTSPSRIPALVIWIDGDAAPREAKELIFRAAQRLQLQVRLVANQSVAVPSGNANIQCLVVPFGANQADRYIVDNANPGDLAITADIPLAAALIEKGVSVVDPRGELFHESNIHSRLAARNVMDAARGAGMELSGPRPYSQKDRSAFASALDRTLTRLMKQTFSHP